MKPRDQGRGRAGWAAGVLHCLLVLTFVAPAPTDAQAIDPPTAASSEPLFEADDAWIAASFLLGTAALAPLDLAVAEAIQHERFQTDRFLGSGASFFRSLGHPGALLISGGFYAGGLLASDRDLAEIGLHTGEAIVLASAVTYATKVLVGRGRPYLDTGDPFDFGLMRGWGRDQYRSFPSGHSTAAFAAAAAFTTETSIHAPGARNWVGVLLYGSAALVAISRLYHNEHWASDIVAGAAVGTFGGRKVVRYMHSHPNNDLDRLLLPDDSPGPDPSNVVLLWSVPVP